jgi:hypothetical protein
VKVSKKAGLLLGIASAICFIIFSDTFYTLALALAFFLLIMALWCEMLINFRDLKREIRQLK